MNSLAALRAPRVHDTLYVDGVWFFTSHAVKDLRNHILTLRYFRQGSFVVKNIKHYQVLYYNNLELLTIEYTMCHLTCNCYMNLIIIQHVNKFLEVLGIKYEIYLRNKQPRIRGEEDYIIWF